MFLVLFSGDKNLRKTGLLVISKLDSMTSLNLCFQGLSQISVAELLADVGRGRCSALDFGHGISCLHPTFVHCLRNLTEVIILLKLVLHRQHNIGLLLAKARKLH